MPRSVFCPQNVSVSKLSVHTGGPFQPLPCKIQSSDHQKGPISKLYPVYEVRTTYVFRATIDPRSQMKEVVNYAISSLRYSLRAAGDRLVGLVVKASTSREDDPGFESRLRRNFSGDESYQWLKN